MRNTRLLRLPAQAVIGIPNQSISKLTFRTRKLTSELHMVKTDTKELIRSHGRSAAFSIPSQCRLALSNPDFDRARIPQALFLHRR